VYGESLDDILGIVHAKDILAGPALAKGGSLRAVLRPAVFVPGTREVEDVLADMKRQKIHLAIVLDEFGGTAGLVTMEDLLEENRRPDLRRIRSTLGRAARRARRRGARHRGLGPDPRGQQRVRAGAGRPGLHDHRGFLFGAIGRLPRPGDQVAVKGAVFEIVEVEGRRVGTVRVLRRRGGRRG